jgi:hypothetical protein
MKALKLALRQLWEKVDRRAKKEQVRALEIRLGLVEVEIAELRKEIANAKN